MEEEPRNAKLVTDRQGEQMRREEWPGSRSGGEVASTEFRVSGEGGDTGRETQNTSFNSGRIQKVLSL